MRHLWKVTIAGVLVILTAVLALWWSGSLETRDTGETVSMEQIDQMAQAGQVEQMNRHIMRLEAKLDQLRGEVEAVRSLRNTPGAAAVKPGCSETEIHAKLISVPARARAGVEAHMGCDTTEHSLERALERLSARVARLEYLLQR
jgi:hypothetical protein